MSETKAVADLLAESFLAMLAERDPSWYTSNTAFVNVLPVRGRFTKSVASETAKQGPTKAPVSLHWAGRIGLN